VPKAVSLLSDTLVRHYKSYTYTNTSGTAQCVTVSVLQNCGDNAVQSVAYLNSFNPAAIQTNYLADGGASGHSFSYSFTLPAGQSAVVVMVEVSPNLTCAAYSLNISACPPPTATPTVPPTNTPLPTNTSTPTDTPAPTNTPVPPTNTLTPTPTVPPTLTPTMTPTLTPTPTVPPTRTSTAVPPTLTSTPVPPTVTRTAVPPTLTSTPVPPTVTRTAVPPTLTSTPVPPTLTRTAVPPTRTSTPVLPTLTRTAVPPTRTSTPVPPTRTPAPPTATTTCVPETPIPIVTPAFTPGPGCGTTPAPGVVTGSIIDHLNTTEAQFTNHSATCSYPIGLAIYRRFDNNINQQQLYDYSLAVIPPNSTLVLTVNNPSCAYQADAFYGDLIASFAGGVRYNERRLDDTNGVNHNRCVPVCPPR
jgi:hypothetical protein